MIAVNDDANGISLLKDKFPYIEHGHNEDNLPAVLNTMLNEFHNKKNYNNKKLIWFTNNDKPFNNDKSKHNLLGRLLMVTTNFEYRSLLSS